MLLPWFCFIYFEFKAKSLILLCESAQRRGSHDLLCFNINTLRPSDAFMHRWFMSSLVKTIVRSICRAKPLSKPSETHCLKGVSYPLLSSPKSLFKVRTEIISIMRHQLISKTHSFADHLYIDWPVAMQQCASKADVMGLPYRDYHTPIANPYNS